MAIKKVRMKPPGYTDIVHPETSADVVIEDASHRFVTDSEKGIWNAKQAAITGGATTITSSNLTASRALVSDASGKVAVSSATSTELGYLTGVTSAIQTQLNGKADTIHNHPLDGLSNITITSNTNGEILRWNGSRWVNNTLAEAGIQPSITGGATTIASSNLTASRALVSDGSGKVAVSAVTSTELGYLTGVTGAIQEQLNTKVTSSSAIVESGSNANGSYVKFGDGTLICYRNLGGTTSGSGNIDASIDFPVLFVGTEPTVTAQLKCITHQNWQGQLFQGTTGFNSVRFVVTGAAASQNYAINYTAIGRWK